MNRIGTPLAAGLAVWLLSAGALAAAPDPEPSVPADADEQTAEIGAESNADQQEAEAANEPSGPPVEEIEPRTIYLEERLYLTLRDAPGGDGERIGVLKSGDRLTQTARRDGYARVETPDGTIGWVAARFLTEETPVGAQLAQAQKRVESLQAELNQARRQLAGTREELSETNEQLAAAKERAETQPDAPLDAKATETADLEERIKELEGALAEARNRANRPENQQPARSGTGSDSVPLEEIGILSGTAGLALMMGFAAGVRWHNKRTRERLGGLKL